MSGTRRALIVANDTYDHASFAQLRAPAADAEALADVLGDPEIGGFTVAVVHNEPSYDVQTRIEDVFADSRPDDLLLLHFSGTASRATPASSSWPHATPVRPARVDCRVGGLHPAVHEDVSRTQHRALPRLLLRRSLRAGGCGASRRPGQRHGRASRLAASTVDGAEP